MFQELRAANDNHGLGYDLCYWRTRDGREVDFVLYGERGLVAIDVKRASRFNERDLDALRLFAADYPMARCLLLYGGQREYVVNSIRVMPLASEDLMKFLSARVLRNRPGYVRTLVREDDLVLTARGAGIRGNGAGHPASEGADGRLPNAAPCSERRRRAASALRHQGRDSRGPVETDACVSVVIDTNVLVSGLLSPRGAPTGRLPFLEVAAAGHADAPAEFMARVA